MVLDSPVMVLDSPAMVLDRPIMVLGSPVLCAMPTVGLLGSFAPVACFSLLTPLVERDRAIARSSNVWFIATGQRMSIFLCRTVNKWANSKHRKC